MKNFYIAPPALLQAYVSRGLVAESHHLDLANGRAVAVVSFHDVNGEKQFVAEPEVVALPHPLSGESLGPTHAELLKEFDVRAGDTMFATLKKLNARHALLRL